MSFAQVNFPFLIPQMNCSEEENSLSYLAFGLNPNPVPTFLDSIFFSFSNIVSRSLKRLIPNFKSFSLSFRAIQSVGTVASSKHSLNASIICSSVTLFLKTILDDNILSTYIGFSLYVSSYLHHHTYIIILVKRYIYLIWHISTKGDLV